MFNDIIKSGVKSPTPDQQEQMVRGLNKYRSRLRTGKLEIKCTVDYDQFSFKEGNREINHSNINVLKEQMLEKGVLFTIIIVNDRMEIIDGQHRFFIFKEWGLPVFYVVVPDYGIQEIAAWQTGRPWKYPDWLKHYIKVGTAEQKKEYEMFKWFFNKYGFFRFTAAISFLMDRTTIDSNKGNKKVFQGGRFKVLNLERAKRVAEYLNRIKGVESFKKSKSLYLHRDTGFQMALLKICSFDETFDIDRLIHKMELQTERLVKQTGEQKYIELLEDLYNYSAKIDRVEWVKEYITKYGR